MKRFIKKYKLLIVVFIFIILLVFSFFMIKAYIYNDSLKVVYGNRLKNIENYEISKEKTQQVIKDFSSEDLDFTIEIKGKIINFIFDLKKELTKEELDEIFKLILVEFEKEQEFYDFQFFAKNEEIEYYLIGYKNKENESITYSEYRKVDTNEEE